MDVKRGFVGWGQGTSLSSIRRLEARGQGTLELLVRVAQALHRVGHLENLLVLPVLSIADAERDAAVTRAHLPELAREYPIRKTRLASLRKTLEEDRRRVAA